MRPRAVRAISAVTTHLPVLRQRPSGTSVYRIVTSPRAKRVTCIDGMAQPPQPSRISTPNGRGRWVTRPTITAMNPSRVERTSQMIRCRKRRSTSRTMVRA
jgi:hypothetical protein